MTQLITEKPSWIYHVLDNTVNLENCPKSQLRKALRSGRCIRCSDPAWIPGLLTGKAKSH